MNIRNCNCPEVKCVSKISSKHLCQMMLRVHRTVRWSVELATGQALGAWPGGVRAKQRGMNWRESGQQAEAEHRQLYESFFHRDEQGKQAAGEGRCETGSSFSPRGLS